jgi:hypothetical protein
MTVSFPAGFRCDSVINEVYPEIERKLYPYIWKRSKRISSMLPGIELDDAIQEGRLALLSALAKFDFNKNKGKLESYVGRVLINTYHCMVYEALTQSKVPHVMAQDEHGNWVKRPRFPISLDAMLSPDDDEVCSFEPKDEKWVSPVQEIVHHQLKLDVGKFTMKMYNTLTGIEREVFRCKVHPPTELLRMLYNDDVEFVYKDDSGKYVLEPGFQVTNRQIAKWLPIDKNAVDWAMHKVKKLFTELAKFDEDFSDLFDDVVIGRGWPMIHTRRGTPNEIEGFEKLIMKKRCLDTRPVAGCCQEADHLQTAGEIDEAGKPFWSRKIERYAWGSIVELKKGKEYVKLVIEGRFNPLTGEVFGDGGMREDIPVGWYKTLVKELRNAC